MHLFGGLGLCALLAGGLSFAAATYFKVVKWLGTDWFSADFVKNFGKDFVETPLPVLVVLFGGIGMTSLLMGFLAEMVMRTYYESQGKPTYVMKRHRNMDVSKRRDLGRKHDHT